MTAAYHLLDYIGHPEDLALEIIRDEGKWLLYGEFVEDTPRNRWKHAYSCARTLLKQFTCPHNNLRDCSSAGPDSGNMDHECLDCGRYWSVTLY